MWIRKDQSLQAFLIRSIIQRDTTNCCVRQNYLQPDKLTSER